MIGAAIGSFLHDPVVTAAVMVLMAALFTQGAWHKVSEAELFRATLGAYRIVPERWLPTAASVLAGMEALVPLGLIFAVTRPMSMLLASTLLLGYGLAMAVNLGNGRSHIDCGCAYEAQPLSWALVLRNALLLLFSASCAAPVHLRALDGLDLGAGLLASLGFYGLYCVAEELIRQSARLRP